MRFGTDTTRWSITQRQLAVVGSTLTLLAILLGVGGSWFIAGVAERMSDRMLAASVRSIIDTISVERGQVTLEMPPGAFGILEDRARDNVYYSVHQGRRLLTGYADFPPIAAEGMVEDHPHFRYDRFLDQQVRVVTEVRYLPQVRNPVIVQVAETLDERGALARTMMIGLVLLEATLVGFAIFLLWPAIRWGLRPVIRVQKEIALRDPGKVDFTPLETCGVTPELAGLIGGFNQLLSQLGEATERSRRFTADASHQMRTPLAVLRAHVEVLQNSGDSDPVRTETVADIHDATDRLQRLLTQLLALARAEQDGGQTENQMCDASTVVRSVCVRLAPQAIHAGMELHFDVAGTFNVKLPALLLEEMVANLIDNAVRYGAVGQHITVHVKADRAHDQIAVIDDGPGIPPQFHALATERFFRLPRDQHTAGSGLGLSIVSALAERAGGSLSFVPRQKGHPFRIVVTFNRDEANGSSRRQ